MKTKTITINVFTAEEWEQVADRPVYFGIPIPKRWVRGYVQSWQPPVIHIQEGAPLSVVAHEIGHQLGLEHTTSPGLMAFHPLRLLGILPRKAVDPDAHADNR